MAVIYKLSSGVVLIFFSFVKDETLEKTGYVMFYTVFYRETNDAIRKITSISCICENENNLNWIPFYTKKI